MAIRHIGPEVAPCQHDVLTEDYRCVHCGEYHPPIETPMPENIGFHIGEVIRSIVETIVQIIMSEPGHSAPVSQQHFSPVLMRCGVVGPTFPRAAWKSRRWCGSYPRLPG